MKKNIIKTIAFCICLVVALTLVSKPLKYKYSEGIGAWKEYYEEKADMDVMLFGCSHVLRMINPVVMYDEKGFASYDIATGGEAIWNTYYAIEEALKYQKPDVMVVDVFMFPRGELYDDTHNIFATFGMKRNLTWFKNVMTGVPENKLYYLTRYPVYHARYKDLEDRDFKSEDEIYDNIIKGFLVDEHHWKTKVMPDVSGMKWTDEPRSGPLPERSEEHLKKIVDIAKENDIKLVFLTTPYYTSEENARAHNSVSGYVDDRNVFYWDLNKDIAEIGLDNKMDFRDPDHLNWRGSQKLSRYLANRLSEEFDLEDHRGEKEYSSFEEEYRYYNQLVEDFESGKGIPD